MNYISIYGYETKKSKNKNGIIGIGLKKYLKFLGNPYKGNTENFQYLDMIEIENSNNKNSICCYLLWFL